MLGCWSITEMKVSNSIVTMVHTPAYHYMETRHTRASDQLSPIVLLPSSRGWIDLMVNGMVLGALLNRNDGEKSSRIDIDRWGKLDIYPRLMW